MIPGSDSLQPRVAPPTKPLPSLPETATRKRSSSVSLSTDHATPRTVSDETASKNLLSSAFRALKNMGSNSSGKESPRTARKSMAPSNVQQALNEATRPSSRRLSTDYSPFANDYSEIEDDLSDNIVDKTWDTPEAQARGKVIDYTFKDHEGNKLATETATRMETVDLLEGEITSKKQYLEQKLNDLNSRLDSLPKTDPSRGNLENEKNELTRDILNQVKRLAKLKDTLGVSPESGKIHVKWASTNAARLIFNNFGQEGAKNNYVPLAANMRYQEVRNAAGEKISGVVRSAALSDFSNGETNIQEMEDHLQLRDLFSNLNPDQKVLQRLHTLYDIGTKTKEGNITIDPNKLMKAVQTTGDHIKSAYLDLAKNQAALPDIKLLKEKIAERGEYLDSMFLQELMTHHLGNKEGISGDTVRIAKLGLVDTERGANNDKSGLCLDERNQCLDTHAALKRQDGKTLVYDLDDDKHAFIDHKSGEVHLPKQWRASGSGERAKLKTFYANISIAGNTANKGVQVAINEQFMREMKEELAVLDKFSFEGTLEPKLEAALKEALNEAHFLHYQLAIDLAAGKGGHKRAQMMARLQQLTCFVGVHCYGGKDRTGYIIAALTQMALFRELSKKFTGNKSLLDATVARFGRELLSQASVALNIVADNTGFKAIKLMPFTLSLYLGTSKSDYMIGLADRLFDYGMFIRTFLPAGEAGEGAAFTKPVETKQESPKMSRRKSMSRDSSANL